MNDLQELQHAVRQYLHAEDHLRKYCQGSIQDLRLGRMDVEEWRRRLIDLTNWSPGRERE